MVNITYTFNLRITEGFSGHLDFRLGFNNGKPTGQATLIDAKQLISYEFKVENIVANNVKDELTS